MSTRLSQGNCFFGILYLVLRGKAHEIIGVSTPLWWWPAHFMAANKHGHILHFQRSKLAEELDPFLFPGRFCGISRRKQQTMLANSGRRIKFRTNRVGLVMALMLAFWCVLVVPFWLALFAKIFWWNVKGLFEAISHRS